ncbi:MAG: Smr/MutS family protein [bacterium]|nr:Smr/MutS family protein [bacterium]
MTPPKDRDFWKHFLEGVTPLPESNHSDDLWGEESPVLDAEEESSTIRPVFEPKPEKPIRKRSLVRENAPPKNPEVFTSIDLHGFTLEEGRRHLLLSLRRIQTNRSRCVLVITGKGTRSLIEKGVPGRLRAALMQWVSQEDFRNLVREISPAKPTHGGQGAFYVWVRARSKVSL